MVGAPVLPSLGVDVCSDHCMASILENEGWVDGWMDGWMDDFNRILLERNVSGDKKKATPL